MAEAVSDNVRAAAPPPPAEDPRQVRRQIAGLASPMVVAQLLAMLVPITIIAMMGWMSDEAIHVRGLYMPLAFLFFAVQIAFDATGQTMSALRTGRGERDLTATALSLGAVWLVAGLVLAGVLSAAAPALGDLMGAPPGTRDSFVTFLRWMTLANLTLAWPVLCASALRGTGRARQGAAIMLVGNAVEIGAVAGLGLGLGLDMVSVPLATVLSGLVAGSLGQFLLHRAQRPEPAAAGAPPPVRARTLAWRPEVLGHLLRTGLPVSLSSTVMFGMNFAFVLMLNPLGSDVVSGFATAGTIQNVMFMPGVVLGSAAAIAMNQRRGANDALPLAPVLRTALGLTLTVYAVLTPLLWVLRGPIGHLTSGNPRIAAETAHFFEVVGPSYLVLGLVLTSLMALEQIGGGFVALAATVTYVLGTVVVGAVVSHGADSPTPLYAAMSGMNAGGLLAVAGALAFVRRRDRRRHAHPGSAQARPLWGDGSEDGAATLNRTGRPGTTTGMAGRTD